MKLLRLALAVVVAGLGLTTTACTHALQVRNMETYSRPQRLSVEETPLRVGVRPYAGAPDGAFYFDALVEQLKASPSVFVVRTDYEPAREDSFRPDVVVSIDPVVDYQSSAWNFLITWPGYMIFTPAWNGYVYRADIQTKVVLTDREDRSLGRVEIPVRYDLRHADWNRTVYTLFGWAALQTAPYNARVFDRDVIEPLHERVKVNYATYMLGQLEPRIRTAAGGLPTSAARAD